MLRELQSHVAAAASDGYMALPTAAVRCAAFQETAQALVYDVLMLKVRLSPAHTAALSFLSTVLVYSSTLSSAHL